MDAETIRRAAQSLVLRRPRLDIIPETRRAEFPAVSLILQDHFQAAERAGTLLLPDLTAEGNQTVALFSDYGGESGAPFQTYSFLVCAWDLLGYWQTVAVPTYRGAGLGQKEIAFKDFRMGVIRSALPGYLRALHDAVPGLLFTVVIPRDVVSVFGENSRETGRQIAAELANAGFRQPTPAVAEKMLRIVHISAFLTALLAQGGQKVLWVTDHDAICPTPDAHHELLRLYQNALHHYAPEKRFSTVGGATPFADRNLTMLDLLSATDVTAGSLEHFLTRRDRSKGEEFEVRDGVPQVLQWLCHDGLGLKKQVVMIRARDGALHGSTLKLERTDPAEDVISVGVTTT